MYRRTSDIRNIKKYFKFIFRLTLIFWNGSDFPSIRPLPCTNKLTGEVGTCMYNWSCRHVVRGTNIGTCLDRFLVGCCCKLPVLSPSSTTTKQWLENLRLQVTKRPQLETLETLATVIQIMTLSNKLRKPVSPIYDKVTVRPFSPVPTKTLLLRNQTSSSTPPKSSHVSGTHLVEVIPAKFHPPAYLTTLTASSVTPLPILFTQQSSSSVVTETGQSDSSSLSASIVEKFALSVESSKRMETASPSVTPSTSPSLEVTSTYLYNRDISQICGRSLISPMGRIVGGRKSQYLRWPWMISLRRLEGRNYMHKCGATLLNRFWAITAAHCVDGKSPHEILLRLGEYNFHHENESLPHIERRVYVVAVHPKFDGVSYENDLALLRFYDPVNFSANVLPICLPRENEDSAGQIAVVTGWGRLAEDGELPGFLHEVHMPILTNAECEDMYTDAGYVESIPDVFICAGLSHGGLDACEGDSGGPMMVRRKNGPWALVGLISWGMGCAAPNQPGVYTRITKFIDWISKVSVV